MTTGVWGTFSYMPWVPVDTALILSTTSFPCTTLPNTVYPQSVAVLARWLRDLLSATLMKNWLVAELGSLVLAMAMVWGSFLSPLSASFWMGARVGFFCR